MPGATQQDRRDAIREILETEAVQNQESLLIALKARGFAATQSSVSRDLKELSAVKTAQGYALPAANAVAQQTVDALLRGLTPAGPNLLVIKTAIGAAQQVALALDESGWSDVVGTVAGDDTVFAATPGVVAQRRLMSRMSSAGASP